MKRPDHNDTDMPTFYGRDLRPWRLRLVRLGDRYGRDDCLVHEQNPHHKVDADPLVEFYDASQSVAKFGPRGQFVSRYYASTLLAGRGGWRSGENRGRGGLCLDGSVEGWNVDAAVMTQVCRWLAAQEVTA